MAEAWVRFEGPGKLRMHRWHRVRKAGVGRATLCGRAVASTAVIHDSPEDGPRCQLCKKIWEGMGVHHY
jgi:hypothetical protein